MPSSLCLILRFVLKKWFSLLAMCLCHVLFAAPVQDRKIDPEALLKLTAALDIPLGANLLEEMQKHWLRKPGLER